MIVIRYRNGKNNGKMIGPSGPFSFWYYNNTYIVICQYLIKKKFPFRYKKYSPGTYRRSIKSRYEISQVRTGRRARTDGHIP